MKFSDGHIKANWRVSAHFYSLCTKPIIECLYNNYISGWYNLAILVSRFFGITKRFVGGESPAFNP
jgi:hypothetical protein